MSSSDEDLYAGYSGDLGNIDEFLDTANSHNFDSSDPSTPRRVQRPADYSTPIQPSPRMPVHFPILHTRPPDVPRESPEAPVSGSLLTSVLHPEAHQKLLSPEVSDNPSQENAPTGYRTRRDSSTVLQSPSMSSNSQQDTPGPRVDSDDDDDLLTDGQNPDEGGAAPMISIKSPSVKEEDESLAALDHGAKQAVADGLYDASPAIPDRTLPRRFGIQRPSIFGTGLNLNASSARSSSQLHTPKVSSQRVQQEVIEVDSDSDDDCIFVGMREARPGERRMVMTEGQKPLVKDEPASDSTINLSTPDVVSSNMSINFDHDRERSPTEEEMLAAQASIIPPAMRQAHSDDLDLPRRNHENRKRRRESIASSEEQIDLDTAEIDTAMQVNEDDDDWMHAQEEEDDGSQEEYENLVKLKNALNKDLAKKGHLSFEENGELIRLNNTLARMDRLKAAQAKRAQDNINDDEDTLFIPGMRRRSASVLDNGGEGPSSSRLEKGLEILNDDAAFASILHEEFDRDDDNPFNKNKSKKTRRAPAKNAREFHIREEEKRIEKERAKAQKKKAAGDKGGKAGKVKPGRKGKDKGKGKEKRTKKGSVKVDRGINETRFLRSRSGQDEIGQLILDDLMNCDPVGDRLQNPIFNVGPEPEIDGATRTKTSQLQQLFANIPEGSSKSKGKSDKAKLLQASRSFGYAQVRATNGKWLVNGMQSTLYHHQLLGAQWMVSRELSTEPPHGGLLADSMGLGKTVQTLACMVGNPPTKEDKARNVRATLIVVPSSVVSQWLEEIHFHVDCKKVFPKVMRYKMSAGIPLSVLEDLDIVVTSYLEVMKQFPFPDRKGREEIAKHGYKRWWKKAHEDLGDLHRINWRRVVLDEAHTIKNNAARTSLACQNLKSVYRWCLTGTPLLNKLEE